MPTDILEADDWAILDDAEEIADIAAASELQLRVVWPSGAVLSWHDVDADQHVRVERSEQETHVIPRFPSPSR